MSPFPTGRASVHCKRKPSQNRGVRAEMGIQPRCGQLPARNSAPSFWLQSAGQVQLATYSRMPLRRGFQSLGAKFGICQMAGLSSRLLYCARARVCFWSLGVGARTGMESRHRSAFARAASRSLDLSRGSGRLRVAPPQAPGGVPPPRPYSRGPEAQRRGARGGVKGAHPSEEKTGRGEGGREGGWGGLRRRR